MKCPKCGQPMRELRGRCICGKCVPERRMFRCDSCGRFYDHKKRIIGRFRTRTKRRWTHD